MKHLGYMVVDKCEDWEQPLGLNKGEGMPAAGILEWTDGPRAVFPDRKKALAAIARTDHYRQAFGLQKPEKRFCKIIPLIES